MAHKAHQIKEKETRHSQKKAMGAEGSYSRTALTAGVAAASGAGLIAVSVLGIGPAAVAGAAGYLAYRAMKEKSSDRNAKA
jgi:hypothetical protein